MNNCNIEKPKCGCGEPKCGCTEPFLHVEEMPENPSLLRFNLNGVSDFYDYENMINQTQTDTTITTDSIKRVLNYMAERHMDSISAAELGSILHLADIADVNITNVENNSLLVYQKDNDCSQGCEGITNSWVGWNASEHQGTSMHSIMGFSQNGKPLSMQVPSNGNQFYMLGWNKNRKLSYVQPAIADGAPIDEDKKKWALYLDPETKEIVVVKEDR